MKRTSDSIFFSIIIPLYNRPKEIDELLDTLTRQTYGQFEVLVVEDGSSLDAADIVRSYQDKLDLHYFYIPNGGQGFARNVGFSNAKGDYFIVFDSDCLIPEDYLQTVSQYLEHTYLDAFGGPDAAHHSFTTVQKAISYAMTSPLTTGGIRGNKKHIGTFHPRSFNMGISREVWEQTGGFIWPKKSEDMEFTLRIQQQGFRTGLIPEAFVYHKRRATFSQFFKQAFFFGQGRIRIFRHFRSELKLVHCLPTVFVIGLVVLFLLNILQFVFPGNSLLYGLCLAGNGFLMVFTLALFLHSWFKSGELKVALYSICTAYIQLIAYGCGFIRDWLLPSK